MDNHYSPTYYNQITKKSLPGDVTLSYNDVLGWKKLRYTMAKILKKLSCLEFPESSQVALQYLASCMTSPTGGAIPGLGGGAENFAVEVSQEYILFKQPSKRGQQKKLSARQELQLLEMLCTYLQEAPEGARYSMFSVIFGGKTEECKTSLLAKLVSLALSVGSGAVMDCAALWMQEQGCHSKIVCNLAQKLVEDYCLLFPDISQTFEKLPRVSPLFTCNFITAVATIYPFHEMPQAPPLVLLEHITKWVSSDPCLCSESVRLVRIQSNFSCPFSRLVQWCTLGHLLCLTDNISKSSQSKEDADHSKTFLHLSKLHFSLLQSLQAYKSMELNQELFLMSHFQSLASELVRIYHAYNESVDEEEFQMLIDRLGQVIQVAMVTGGLKIHPSGKDIKTVCDILPHNRLLQIIAAPWNKAMEHMDTS